jgi:hypothetical protein
VLQGRLAAQWKCPRCGVGLVSRNLSHSCGGWSVAQFLTAKGERARVLFTRFEKLVATCGAFTRAPAKTRVAFLAQVRFASVNRATDRGLDVHFVLPRKIEHPRIRRVERIGNLYVHHLRLAEEADFDRVLQGWLRASYDEYGMRRWLRRRPSRPR